MKLWPRTDECRLNTAGKMLRIRIGITRSMSYAVIKSLVRRRADRHRFQFVARLGISREKFSRASFFAFADRNEQDSRGCWDRVDLAGRKV